MSEETVPLAPEANGLLIGQDAAEAGFLRSFASGRTAHAWLLTGPKGIGKATLAFRMARFLLAHGGQAQQNAATGLFGEPAVQSPADATLDMPENHPVFRRVRELAHSDLRVLRRSVNDKTDKLRSEIIIDDVRAAISFLHLTPAESDWRVLIVDPADELNRNAANALLKILEEPRPRTVLILVCHAPGRLLPTIRSRCRKLSVLPLASAVLRESLARLRPDLDPADLSLAAELAEGSIGRALDLAGEVGGLEIFRGIGQLLAGWPKMDTSLMHKLGDRFGGKAGGPRFVTAIDQLDWWLKRFARRAVLGPGSLVDLFPDESAAMDRLLAAANLDRWLQSWEKTNEIFARVASANLDRKQAWLTGWLALSTTGQDRTGRDR